jgi:hypothetical protein
MEINYDLIIKYLATKDPKLTSKTFASQKSILNYSVNFPNKFKELFTDKFYRFGITNYDTNKNNISFWTSLLTLLDKNFLIPYNNDEVSLINQFKEQILDMYKKSKISSFLKEYEKIDMRERFKLDIDLVILQYIVDIMDINFMIFDFETENIEVLYKKDIMNPWKQTLLFAKFENMWEPIMLIKPKGEIQRTFDYNNINVKKILFTPNLVKYYNGNKIKKEYIYIDDISDVIEIEKKQLNKNDLKNDLNVDSDSSVKTHSETDDIISSYSSLNKTKLNKMKVNELEPIVTKLKITIDAKRITRQMMIDNIVNKLNL